MKNTVYKSEAARDLFRACYSQVLSNFPFGQQYIPTTFGQTFMLTSGQASNPPVILLHGSCSNSAFWFSEIMTLSANYRVYAVDIIGEAGNSAEERPSLDTDAFAIWLGEVLTALELEKAALIGNSLGGWMSLKFATAYPERVSRLILIASAGLAEIRPQFMQSAEKALKEDNAPPVSPLIIGNNEIPKEVLDFMNLIIASYNPIPSLPAFTDGQLRKLTMPVLFIDGENDVIIDAPASAERLCALVPSAEIHLIPNCSHVVTQTAPFMIPFLGK